MTAICMKMPPGPPSHVRNGNVRARGPQLVAWMSRSTVASIDRYGCMTTTAARIPNATAATIATASRGPLTAHVQGGKSLASSDLRASREGTEVESAGWVEWLIKISASRWRFACASRKPALGSKPFEAGRWQPAFWEPQHKGRPADAEQHPAHDVARPVGAGPDPGDAGEHD